MPRSAGSLRRSSPTPYQRKYGVRSDPLDQERACDASSPTSRGDEAKLDPKILSLINAACAQVMGQNRTLRAATLALLNLSECDVPCHSARIQLRCVKIATKYCFAGEVVSPSENQ